MLQYTVFTSKEGDVTKENQDVKARPLYGLRAVDEQGHVVMELPTISSDIHTVEYLAEHFNQVRMKREDL